MQLSGVRDSLDVEQACPKPKRRAGTLILLFVLLFQPPLRNDALLDEALLDEFDGPDVEFLTWEELLEDRSRAGQMILVFGTMGSMKLVENWVCRMTGVNMYHFSVVGLDPPAQQYADWHGWVYLPVTAWNGSLTSSASGDSVTGNKHHVLEIKLLAVLTMLKMGYGVVATDADIFWLDNVMRMIRMYNDYDVIAYSGGKGGRGERMAFDTAFMYFRPTKASINGVREALLWLLDEKQDPQTIMDNVFCKTRPRTRLDECVGSPGIGARTKFLPPLLFPTNRSFLRSYLARETLLAEPYFLHFDSQYAGVEPKIIEMKDRHMWLVRANGRCKRWTGPALMLEQTFSNGYRTIAGYPYISRGLSLTMGSNFSRYWYLVVIFWVCGLGVGVWALIGGRCLRKIGARRFHGGLKYN